MSGNIECVKGLKMRSALKDAMQGIVAFAKCSPIRAVAALCGVMVLIGIIVAMLTMKSGGISETEIRSRSVRVLQLRKEIMREEQVRLAEWKKLNRAVESEEQFDAAMIADGLIPVNEGGLKSCGSIGVGSDAAFSFEKGALQYRVEGVDCQKMVLIHTYDKNGVFIESVSFDVDGEWVYERRELTKAERDYNQFSATMKQVTEVNNMVNGNTDPLSLGGIASAASMAIATVQASQTHTLDKRWQAATCSGKVRFADKEQTPAWYLVCVCDPGIIEKSVKFIRELF